MKAFIIKEPGAVSQLELKEIPTPVPGNGEILIRTKAISINPVDAKTRAGKGMYGRLKDIPELILGWDISGEVVSVGNEVGEFAVGDAVFGMIHFPGHGKVYAEYVTAPASQMAKKPGNITFEEAAAATLAPLTAYQFLKGNVRPGDKVIIQSAAGGVGHFAVQIAVLLGAEVTGITSTANVDFVKSLGATEVIDYKKEDYSQRHGFDFALDSLGGEQLLKLLETVKDGGKIVTLPSGANLDDAKDIAVKRGITLWNQLVESNGKDMEQLAAWLASGKLKPHISDVFDFLRLPDAHAAIETGKTKGKIVVKL